MTTNRPAHKRRGRPPNWRSCGSCTTTAVGLSSCCSAASCQRCCAQVLRTVTQEANLEKAGGAVNAARLEQALRNAGFEPDAERVWRWSLRDASGIRATVKFELLADLDTEPAGATVAFSGCDRLGALSRRC